MLFRGVCPFSFSYFFSILKIINKGIRQKEKDGLYISSLPGVKLGNRNIPPKSEKIFSTGNLPTHLAQKRPRRPNQPPFVEFL
jgi:hypothetical protein